MQVNIHFDREYGIFRDFKTLESESRVLDIDIELL